MVLLLLLLFFVINIVIKNSNNNILLKKEKKTISELSQSHIAPDWVWTWYLRVSYMYLRTKLLSTTEWFRLSDHLVYSYVFNEFTRRFDHKLFSTLYVLVCNWWCNCYRSPILWFDIKRLVILGYAGKRLRLRVLILYKWHIKIWDETTYHYFLC